VGGVGPKLLESSLCHLHVMLQRGRVGLPKTVDVNDCAQVVQLVEASKVEGLRPWSMCRRALLTSQMFPSMDSPSPMRQ
jgi:hypothetical protein